MEALRPGEKALLHGRTPFLFHRRTKGETATRCGLPGNELRWTDNPGERAPCFVCFEPARDSELHFDVAPRGGW